MIGDLIPSDPFACWVGIQFTHMGLDDDNWPVIDQIATLKLPYQRSPGVFACVGGDCGCIFWPDVDGDDEDAYVYVDRWQPARRDRNGEPYGCEYPTCECHNLVHLDDDNRHVLEIIQPRVAEGGQPGDSDPALPIA